MNNAENIAATICKLLPKDKRDKLKKSLETNYNCTSSYMLEHGTLTKYKEGYYVELKGVKSKFSVFYSLENKFIRKPSENKLHLIESENLLMDETSFNWIKKCY